MALLYLFSAIAKSNIVWWRGLAVAGILTHDFFASPLSAHLLQFPRLLMGMTWGTLFLEWLAPVLLFFPRWTFRVRLGTVAALAAMHLSIILLLEVDLFSPVSLAGLALFLPKEFWDSRLLAGLSKRSAQAGPQPASAGAARGELGRPFWL